MFSMVRGVTGGLAHAGVGLTFAGIVGGMTYLGHLADAKWGTHPWLVVTGGLLGSAYGIYDLMSTILRSSDRAKRRNEDGDGGAD